MFKVPVRVKFFVIAAFNSSERENDGNDETVSSNCNSCRIMSIVLAEIKSMLLLQAFTAETWVSI